MFFLPTITPAGTNVLWVYAHIPTLVPMSSGSCVFKALL